MIHSPIFFNLQHLVNNLRLIFSHEVIAKFDSPRMTKFFLSQLPWHDYRDRQVVVF